MAQKIWDKRFALRVAYSFPIMGGERDRLYPVLCFLHGNGECERGSEKGKDLLDAVKDHGPLRPGSHEIARERFIIVAPQLKYPGGDKWDEPENRSTVISVVRSMVEQEGGDPGRVYLTGFSYGGNGVLSIAARDDFPWAAVWAVDPPQKPVGRLHCPVRLTAGQYARKRRDQWVRGLNLQENPNDLSADRVYEDYAKDYAAEDHAETSWAAYENKNAYEWLLRRTRP